MPGKGSSRKSGKRGDLLQQDDLALWDSVVSDVRPLTKRQTKINNPSLSTQEASKPLNQRQIPTRHDAIRAETAPNLSHGRAPGLDKRTQLRLRRGQVQVEAKLDLHGMTQSEAHAALIRFLERAQMGKLKTVLVVTGKGLRADGRVGVLRNAVPRWLNEAPMRAFVHAFDHAAPQDGGEGALYIVMRRRK